MALEIESTMNFTNFDALMEMAREMHSESPRYRHTPFSVTKTRALIDHFHSHPGGFVAFNGETSDIIGMAAGMVVEHFFSDQKFACDLVFYVKKQYRGTTAGVRLIKAFEDWAFSAGADEVSLGVSTGVEQERTVSLYHRMGYALVSQGMLKKREN